MVIYLETLAEMDVKYLSVLFVIILGVPRISGKQ